jgi:hypothetical protein
MTVQFGDYQKSSNGAMLARPIIINTETFLKEYKDIFAWNYTNLKGVPPQIT